MYKLISVTNRKLCKGDFRKRLAELASMDVFYEKNGNHGKNEGYEIQKIILREKDLSEEAYETLAKEAYQVCGEKLVIHNFPSVARHLGIRKIHLPLSVLRSLSEEDKMFFTEIGTSIHSPEEGKEAETLGCTYLIAGHIYETDCKKGVSGRGLGFLKTVTSQTSLPVYAIGGICPDNIADCVENGAYGGCMMSSLMVCENPGQYLGGFMESRIKFDRRQLLLYGVTDCPEDKEGLYEKVRQALEGGVTILQLRLKDSPREEVVAVAKKLLPICHSYQVPLIINDDPEAAFLSGADGVHVGLEDMSVLEIREKYGSDFIVGATAKTIQQAKFAKEQGADYLGCGAVFPSPTKKNAIRITNQQLNEISDAANMPIVAIGGINEQNARSLVGSRIDGIAVVSALFSAKDTVTAAGNLLKIAKEIKETHMNYTTQMDAARKGIVTPQIAEVAKKENMPVEQLMKLVAEGKVAICANKNHKCLNPEGVGSMLRTKINVNLGVSRDCKDYDIEMQKVMSAVELGAEAIMDLSSHGNTQPFRRKLTSECPAMIGTVPVYDSVIHYQRDLSTLTAKDFIDVVRLHAEDGVDFVTLHCGITRKTIEQIKNHKRKMNIVSRGGSLVFAWMSMTGQENPFYEYYDEILDICEQYDVTISLGDACRPGCLADATDVCQIEELVRLGELTKRAWAHNVQVMVEGPGHMPLNQIAANMQVQQTICMGAPFYVLGPLVTDIAPGYDHITSAIGGAIAATNGAAFLCYVTPAEHLALPNVEDVKQGIIASKIAAHAADIAKGIPGARDIDDRMADARRNLDWEGQYACALDPETAKAIRDSRMPEEDHSDTCSMCGKFCAVRSMNKALAGEYIDIL